MDSIITFVRALVITAKRASHTAHHGRHFVARQAGQNASLQMGLAARAVAREGGGSFVLLLLGRAGASRARRAHSAGPTSG